MARDPLVDLPLDRFYPSSVDASATKRTAHKRPPSPGLSGSALFSPAKRRMLAQGGLGSPLGPRTRSPLSDFAAQLGRTVAVDGKSEQQQQRRAATPAATGEDENNANATAPTSVTRAVRTSPRLAARHQVSVSTPTSAARRNSRASSTKPSSAPSTSVAPSREGSPMISRQRPSAPDRSSRNYPGFDVHFDTLVSASVAVGVPSRARSVSPDHISSKPPSRGEADKENVRPKKPRRGSATAEKKATNKSANSDAVPRRSPRLSEPASGDVAMAMDA